MTTSTVDREQAVTEIALGMEGALEDWKTGRLPSPDDRDYVIIATETLARLFPGYVPTERTEEMADLLYEESNAKGFDVRQTAEWLYDELALGIPA